MTKNYTKLGLLFGMLLMAFVSNAQSTFKGSVVDAGENLKLANASVILLNAADSILIAHSRADENGRFTIQRPESGEFLLLITYPKYGEYNRILKPTDPADLGTISLSSVAHLIEEVLVTGKIPVVMKGDTTEYDASSFVVEKNAKVEDLLKVLPGITVDANGKITAQGKTVEKVLVDGEEFFGNDPTLVTRNIRSDMVDKVQVFEKKSDDAERTGVDDGVRQQTINLTLKEDAKRGVFGKVEAGGGAATDKGYYLGRLAVNQFNGSRKLSAFAVGSNNGEVFLNWQDAERFNFSSGITEISDAGVMFIYAGDSDPFGSWNGVGNPRAFNTGLNFMDSWKENKQKLNMNYKYGRIWNDSEERTISQNNLPNGQINSENNATKSSDANRHKLNAHFDWKLDSLTSLSLGVTAGRDQSLSDQFTAAETRDQNQALLNNNDRLQNSNSLKNEYIVAAYLTRKMKKPGRSITLSFNGKNTDNDGTSFLKSTTNIYRAGQLDSVQVIDQMKDIRSKASNINTSVSYTEPLTSMWNLGLSYNLTNSINHSINDSYNKDASNNYTQLDQLYSNNFDYEQLRNQASLTVRYKTDKVNLNFVNQLRKDDLFQRNNYLAKEVKRDFLTFNPSMNFNYNLTKTKVLSANIRRTNQLPSLSQINPLRENTDPLNIVEGNENLSPSNINSVSLSFNSYQMLKMMYTYLSLSYSQTNNSIQSNSIIDPLTGIRTSSYVNLKDKSSQNLSFFGGTSFPITKSQIVRGDLFANLNFSEYYSYVNGSLSKNNQSSYSLDLNFSKNTTKDLDFGLNLSPGWQIMNNSLQPEFNSDGFTFSSNSNINWHLPKKFVLYSTLNYFYEAPTKAFDEKFERVEINPSLKKKFLENESLMLTFSVNDLLNQNKGFRRSQSGNTISQRSYNTIGRYFMLTVSWDFTKMGVTSK